MRMRRVATASLVAAILCGGVLPGTQSFAARELKVAEMGAMRGGCAECANNRRMCSDYNNDGCISVYENGNLMDCGGTIDYVDRPDKDDPACESNKWTLPTDYCADNAVPGGCGTWYVGGTCVLKNKGASDAWCAPSGGTPSGTKPSHVINDQRSTYCNMPD